MKEFLQWFKKGAKIKRWLFLVLLGMALTCYGISNILVQEKIEIVNLLYIIGTFILGFTLFIIGIVSIQKRTLELGMEANRGKKVAKDLMTGNNIYEKGPNIVVIGGGSGLNHVLMGLKKYTNNITAIVSVTDYGNTKNKKNLNEKPTTDIQESIVALSRNNEEVKKLFDYRFKNKKISSDYTFGDMYLAAMQDIYGKFEIAIEQSSDILSMFGRVLPVTLDEMNICAELQDGTIVEEKSKLAEIVSNKVTKIERVFLNPSNCRIAPGVIDAIKQAEIIVIGPGSLYTNVIPNLLIRNVAKTIRESKAIKVYISNLMTEPGQTDDYSVSDHIKAIQEHAGNEIIDYCIADTGEIVPEFIKKYNLKGSNLVDSDMQRVNIRGVTLIKENISKVEQTYIRHDPDILAKTIIELKRDELKFKDKQTNDKYLLMNSKIKEQEEKIKVKEEERKKLEKKAKKSEPKEKKKKKESKFNLKYKDRIESIKESEKTRLENIKIQNKAMKMIEEDEKKEKEEFLKSAYNKKK